MASAEIENDDGGPVFVSGEVNVTFPFFGTFWPSPNVILRDATYYVTRDKDLYVPDQTTQVLGPVTSDPRISPFTYELQLPARPNGVLHDVDNNDDDDDGMMIFAVSLVNDFWGNPFVEERDGQLSLDAYSTVVIGVEQAVKDEILGGNLILYAPDDEQGFPTGFGPDGLLFTEDDDAAVRLPQGYTVVNLDSEPFLFDRSEEVALDLLEIELVALDDFSDLSYTEAFDDMIEKMRREYAFTDYKHIDWDALVEEFRPRFEEAEAESDVLAYRLALRDFTWEIPDGHVSAPLLTGLFQEAVAGGVGFSMRDVDDGRIIVDFITEDSPADDAGMELGAEILEIKGTPVEEYVENIRPWSLPFSTEHFKRLQQLRYALRFTLDTGEVEFVFQNPGDDEPTTASLQVVPENESFGHSSFNRGRTFNELPVEFEILDSGFGYVRIYSFSDNLPLMVALWERMINTMNANGVQGIIIDIRQNGGGSAYLGDQLPAYFFDEEYVLGNSAFYDESVDDFVIDPDDEDEFVLVDPSLRFEGEIAVLVGPNCASACESFAYNMTLGDRAAIVGQYPTAGLGGSVEDFNMPEGVSIRFTIGRSLDADGNIHIEGIGVVPNVHVPVTEETLLTDEDVVLQYAIDFLDGELNVPTTDGGSIAVGETVEGELVEGERVRFTLEVQEDAVLDFIVSDEDRELDTVLRLYVQGSAAVAAQNDDDPAGGTVNSALREVAVPSGLIIEIEVGGFDDSVSGTFSLTVQESPTPDDEPNNSTETNA